MFKRIGRLFVCVNITVLLAFSFVGCRNKSVYNDALSYIEEETVTIIEKVDDSETENDENEQESFGTVKQNGTTESENTEKSGNKIKYTGEVSSSQTTSSGESTDDDKTPVKEKDTSSKKIIDGDQGPVVYF